MSAATMNGLEKLETSLPIFRLPHRNLPALHAYARALRTVVGSHVDDPVIWLTVVLTMLAWLRGEHPEKGVRNTTDWDVASILCDITQNDAAHLVKSYFTTCYEDSDVADARIPDLCSFMFAAFEIAKFEQESDDLNMAFTTIPYTSYQDEVFVIPYHGSSCPEASKVLILAGLYLKWRGFNQNLPDNDGLTIQNHESIALITYPNEASDGRLSLSFLPRTS